ncbi:MAG: SDR family NAD(P)-dependent oxidoreductase [Bacteroidota bacterium]
MKTERVALITEAGNGLSSQWANILKNAGFKVVIAAKGISYTHLDEQNLEDIQLSKVDFTKTEEVVQLYAFIKTRYDKLDVLVNNAEMANGFGQKLSSLKMQEVKYLFDENLFSVMELTKTLLPLLKKGQSPKILNISSALGNVNKMGRDDFPYSDYKMTAYSMAKASLEMFTTLIYGELKTDGILIASFDPVKMKNCTHNSVTICREVQKEFLQQLSMDPTEQIQRVQKR